MLGIALGSFTQGFSQGVNLRTQMDEVARQRDLRKSVQGITQTGKAAYDADVAAGKAEPGDFMSRYTNELMPQIAEKYLEAGEPDKAAAWTDWATSTAAKKATKEFNQGLQQFQMGDVEAGLKSMKKAANTNGYGPDGKTSVAEIYDEDAGAVTGYRLTYTLPDGKQHTKNVATADLPNFFAATINPQSAFELQQASAAAQSKADLEVETYTRKKKAEKELGVGAGAMTQAQYQNAIQEERKRIEDASLLSGEELTDDEKEAQAKELVDKRLGLTGAAPTEPQIAVDPETGEQVQLPTTPAQDATSQVQPQAPTRCPGRYRRGPDRHRSRRAGRHRRRGTDVGHGARRRRPVAAGRDHTGAAEQPGRADRPRRPAREAGRRCATGRTGARLRRHPGPELAAVGAARRPQRPDRDRPIVERIVAKGIQFDPVPGSPRKQVEPSRAVVTTPRTRAPTRGSDDVRQGIIQTAQSLGVDPVDVATSISYETGGTFNPTIPGPVTKYGRHRGLIQFGEPQAQKYGVDWSNPVGSQLGPDGAVAKYLREAGVKPGMGLLDIYSAINAGRVGRYGASDTAAGGAPGNVADKVRAWPSTAARR